MQIEFTTHHENGLKRLQEELAEAQDRNQKQKLENQKVKNFIYFLMCSQ